ncbi:MAG: prepilin-type N-terminal cleavage/methylation domain-containing protein [Deltaproteobacteria bacterium]|nr:prepilin-type N-terminal cleavage/methylation domain-containing protein [Deltaproteobacteria bacterium]
MNKISDQIIKLTSNKNRDGFSLVEVMIAMTLFSVALLGIAQMQITAFKTNSQANNISRASVYASDKLEELRALGRNNFSDPQLAAGNHPATGDPTQPTITPFTRTWTITDNYDTGTAVVISKSISVSLSGPPPTHTLVYTTVVAR